MRTAFQVLSIVFLMGGVTLSGFGILALGYSWMVSLQPAPSLNEGPGLAGLLGVLMVFSGLVSLALALAMRAGANAANDADDAAAKREWAREHRRLW